MDQRLAVAEIMEEHDRVTPAGLGIGDKQRAQPPQQRIGPRHRIFGGAGRAGRRAAAAAGADLGVDGDVIAGRLNGAGRAQLEAARAADDPRARMGAEISGEIDEAGLVELADQVGRLPDRLGERGAVARIDPDVAVAQFVRRKERRASGEVEHDVAMRDGTVPRRAEAQPVAGGRQGCRKIVDDKLEGTEMAARIADRALRDREVPDLVRHDVARPRKEHRDVEPVGEPASGFDRDFVAAEDQDDAAALERHQRRRGRLLGSHGEQRRGLRAGVGAFVRPARHLAHIAESEVAGKTGLGGQLAKKRRLLRAADRHRVGAAEHLSNPLEFGAAELPPPFDRRARTAARNRAGIIRIVASQEQTRIFRFFANSTSLPGSPAPGGRMVAIHLCPDTGFIQAPGSASRSDAPPPRRDAAPVAPSL